MSENGRLLPGSFETARNQSRSFTRSFCRTEAGRSFRPRSAAGIGPTAAWQLSACDSAKADAAEFPGEGLITDQLLWALQGARKQQADPRRDERAIALPVRSTRYALLTTTSVIDSFHASEG